MVLTQDLVWAERVFGHEGLLEGMSGQVPGDYASGVPLGQLRYLQILNLPGLTKTQGGLLPGPKTSALGHTPLRVSNAFPPPQHRQRSPVTVTDPEQGLQRSQEEGEHAWVGVESGMPGIQFSRQQTALQLYGAQPGALS